MRKRREGVTKQGVTSPKSDKNVTPEVEMVTDQFGTRPRFLKLSGGQIYDRAKPVEATNIEAFRMKYGSAMIACNRVKGLKMSKQERLGRLLMSLDKDITGLDNKRLNLLTTVRWGISGKTLKEIRDLL